MFLFNLYALFCILYVFYDVFMINKIKTITIKTYVRSKMKRQRYNKLLILHIHKDLMSQPSPGNSYTEINSDYSSLENSQNDVTYSV